MNSCRFCAIANSCETIIHPENEKIIETQNFFAISSIGALVEGWMLLVPKEHLCSMKSLYADREFIEFANDIIAALLTCYGPVIAFEHGPNRENSATSCGTNHAHIHFVPYHSLLPKLQNMPLEWHECRASQIENFVSGNEYLFYCEPGSKWEDPLGQVHILKEPISQFFRKVIAEDLGCPERFNYKTRPDTVLTLNTIEKTKKFFSKCCEA